MRRFRRRHGLLLRPTPGLRVGTDLTSVSDVRHSVQHFGDRYLDRVYTRAEVESCRQPDGGVDAARLAARFAAKESVVKALGITSHVGYRNIEVRSDGNGPPSVVLHSPLDGEFGDRAVALSLSMTHDRDYAAAVVVCTIDG